MEIIFTKIAQPNWVLKIAVWMVLLMLIHAKFVSPFMGTRGLYH